MLHPSGTQWVILVALSILWAALGYRLSENDRRTLGRTPWGLPSALWAFFWFLSLVLGLVLYLIAHTNGVRRARQGLSVPGSPPATGWAMTAPSVAEQFPAYPRPANSQTPPPVGVGPTDGAGGAVNTGSGAAGSRDAGTCRALDPGAAGRARLVAALAPGLASRSQREVPLSLVGRLPMDLAGVDRRASSDRHQPRSADRPLLIAPEGTAVHPARSAVASVGAVTPAVPAGAAAVDGEPQRA